LIVPIGAWVLRDACRHLRLWRDAASAGGGSSHDLRAAVNLSVRQLQEPGFVHHVARVLAEFELPANALELEITESIAVHVSETTLQTLRDLKRLGTRIVMDDFGTGYSSLSALRLFPVDGLKIDRSFVHGALPSTQSDGAGGEHSAIASAVIALAHSLHLTVVAEGVETEAQLDFLRESGCDSWQGYLCSRPVPAATYATLLMDGAAAGAGSAAAMR
jgi:EAL domain-containing protein (putative c-di-GMP-specific phosphodiesterase class I)